MNRTAGPAVFNATEVAVINWFLEPVVAADDFRPPRVPSFRRRPDHHWTATTRRRADQNVPPHRCIA